MVRRFIPTGVGNICLFVRALFLLSVHPHGRGEHVACMPALRLYSGSSPRAWGTFVHRRVSRPLLRFIPTGVGNMALNLTKQARKPVHPHGRGEHSAAAVTTVTATGSSPRAWGTSFYGQSVDFLGRFIPTGVGNIISGNAHAQGAPVHPHGRGEHGFSTADETSSIGSSPRAWGT